MATVKALRALGVSKTFTEGPVTVPVLRDICLEVDAGEIVALEGPSGSGKTTLLLVFGCILTPSSGRVIIGGQEVDSSKPSLLAELRRQHIGFVFQQFNLISSLNVLENVEYALNIKGQHGPDARRRAEELLVSVEMGDRLAFYPSDLSGGQKQRVAIARALAAEPTFICADEPTANLDSRIGLQTLELFRDLARRHGRGVLIATHDPNVGKIVDRKVVMREGRLHG